MSALNVACHVCGEYIVEMCPHVKAMPGVQALTARVSELSAELVETRAECDDALAGASTLRLERDYFIRRHDEARAELAAVEADQLRTLAEREAWEEFVGDLALELGCDREWSNLHDHRECVQENAAALIAVLERIRDDVGLFLMPDARLVAGRALSSIERLRALSANDIARAALEKQP